MPVLWLLNATTTLRMLWPKLALIRGVWLGAELYVTPQNMKLVDFVRPYYYTAGVILFAPNGTLPGVSSWNDIGDMRLAMVNASNMTNSSYDPGRPCGMPRSML